MNVRYFTGLVASVVFLPIIAVVAGQDSTGQVAPPEPARKLERAELGGAPNVNALNGVYLAGQPQPEDFRKSGADGIKTVVSLRQPDELDWDEAAIVQQVGMEYLSIPFQSPKSLTDEVFDEVRRVLNDKKKRPMILHCHSANRVGAVWLVHRVLDGGVAYAKALAEAKQVGLRLPAYEQKAKVYIKRRSKPQKPKAATSQVPRVRASEFAAQVLRSTEPVLVDFYASWCPPCTTLAPVLERLAAEYEGEVKFVKVDVDEESQLAGRYDVSGLPTLVLFRDGVVVDRIVGSAAPNTLRSRINSLAATTETPVGG